MEPIFIDSSEESPKVTLDAANGVFEISGKSYPEDSTQVYLPVLEWLLEYAKKPNAQTNFVFSLEYFNTASQKSLLDIMLTLENLSMAGHDIMVTWHYDREDEGMKDTGEEFELLVAVPFTLVEDINEEPEA